MVWVPFYMLSASVHVHVFYTICQHGQAVLVRVVIPCTVHILTFHTVFHTGSCLLCAHCTPRHVGSAHNNTSESALFDTLDKGLSEK